MIALLKTKDIFRPSEPAIVVNRGLTEPVLNRHLWNKRRGRHSRFYSFDECPYPVLVSFQNNPEFRIGQPDNYRYHLCLTPMPYMENYNYCYEIYSMNEVKHHLDRQLSSREIQIVYTNSIIAIVRREEQFYKNTLQLAECNDFSISEQVYESGFIIFKRFMQIQVIPNDKKDKIVDKLILGNKLKEMIEGADNKNLELVARKKLINLSVEIISMLKDFYEKKTKR